MIETAKDESWHENRQFQKDVIEKTERKSEIKN